MKATTSSVLFLALLSTAPLLAQPAPSTTPTRITGVPARDPRVTLSVVGPASQVLDALAAKAGWSLTASGDNLTRRVSVRTRNQPATEVLTTVVEVADLQARFALGDALVIQDAARAPIAAEEPVADEAQPEQAVDEADEAEARERKHGSGNDRTAVGHDVVVNKDEKVGDVVATGGSVTLHGHATGDVVAVGGSVTLEPGSRVDGDAVSVGGTVEVKPGATLRGERSSVGGPLGKVLSSAIKLSPSKVSREEKDSDGFFGRLWWTIPFFILGFLTMLFAPDRLLSLRTAVSARPWAAVAAGVGSWFGIVALCILLAVTLIGILLIPLALAGYLALGLFGLTALAWWTGAKLSFIPATQRPLVAFSLGTLVFALIGAIPVIGPLTLWLATTVSGGAALLMLIAHLKRRRKPPPPAVAEHPEMGI